MRSGAFWAGMLTGAVIGAAIALIYAPQSGAETRENMSQGVRKFRDAAAERGRRMFRRGREQTEETTSEESSSEQA